MDLYILPKNIKQVFSAFADHYPLLLSTLSKFYMGAVLGITMILCILFKSLLLSHMRCHNRQNSDRLYLQNGDVNFDNYAFNI